MPGRGETKDIISDSRASCKEVAAGVSELGRIWKHALCTFNNGTLTHDIFEHDSCAGIAPNNLLAVFHHHPVVFL